MDRLIAIIIPALNESVTIADVVTRCIKAVEQGEFKCRVIVVDDGSRDDTATIASKHGADVVRHEVNRGVGQAFRTGLQRALDVGADFIVNIDADGQFEPERIPDLLDPILNGRADFTTASRFKNPEYCPEMPRIKILGNRAMSYLISMIAGQRFYDVSCGFRAYSREATLRLNLWGEFTYTQESILDLVVKSMRLEEVPMRIRGEREHGESRVASNLWRYGYRTARIIGNTYRDFWPMRFFGCLSLLCLLPGFGLVSFLFVHRMLSGQFTPHIWAGFTGGAFLGLGIVCLITGVLAQMLGRMRLNQEMLLYFERKQECQSSDKLSGQERGRTH